MEIKKGDRFRCIQDCKGWYNEGNIYQSDKDGSITNEQGETSHIWEGVDYFNDYFESVTDSPTSPSHYKAYDIESIEMMIRIWGKQRVAEWCEITAFKYRCRVGMKDDVQQDLKKEAYYLSKWKELRNDVTG